MVFSFAAAATLSVVCFAYIILCVALNTLHLHRVKNMYVINYCIIWNENVTAADKDESNNIDVNVPAEHVLRVLQLLLML